MFVNLQQVVAMNQEASAMKAKIRRLEEDNLKKEKEIDSLLHPHKVNQILIWYSKLPYAFTRVYTCKRTWSTVVIK